MAPVVISASRSTDLPAFYTDWFFHRLNKGYCAWINPFNRKKYFVSFAHTRHVVFWSKNPRPLLNRLPELKDRGISCTLQFTLNDYTEEGLEPHLPNLDGRIKNFLNFSELLGPKRVVWRFDPLLLAQNIDEKKLLEKLRNIGNALRGYTNKLVFSFADISNYRCVQRHLRSANVAYREWDRQSMISFATQLVHLQKSEGWDFVLATCGEGIDLESLGIVHNKCINFPSATSLQPLTDISPESCHSPSPQIRDHGQRQNCRCIPSKDIGQYDTCQHFCTYCYAISNRMNVMHNLQQHQLNPFAETIGGL